MPNDGNADLLGTLQEFTITSSSGVKTTFKNGLTGNSLLQSVIFGSQSVDFQPAPSEVPGPLPLLGAGAAFGFSRRLRKRVKLAGAAAKA